MKKLICAVILLSVSTAEAAIINVPGDEPTIQAGIVAAMNGDEFVVAEGEYFENINFLGKTITVRSTDPNDPVVVMNTIINGGGSGNVVRCIGGEGSNTVLSGFVITGGNALDGGGMQNVGSSPTVTNCSFSGNTAIFGGGMYNEASSNPIVTNCTFSGNSADAGGGMSNLSSSPTVTNCTFSGNTASVGGGMFNAVSDAIVTNCVFSGNCAAGSGGGMVNAVSSPTVTNCTFSGNTATDDGGGMSNGGGSPTVANTGFCGNTPDAIDGSYTEGGGNSLLYCPPPIPKADTCPADIDGDGEVGINDCLDRLAAWGPCP